MQGNHPNPTHPVNTESNSPAPATLPWSGWTEALKAPIAITVEISGRPIRLEIRRLNASERSAIIGWYDENEHRSPKMLPPTSSRGEFNEGERVYRETLAKYRRVARAITVAMVWSEAGQALKNAGIDLGAPEKVLEFIEGNLPEQLIESIYLCSLSDGLSITIGDRVSFTSAGG